MIALIGSSIRHGEGIELWRCRLDAVLLMVCVGLAALIGVEAWLSVQAMICCAMLVALGVLVAGRRLIGLRRLGQLVMFDGMPTLLTASGLLALRPRGRACVMGRLLCWSFQGGSNVTCLLVIWSSQHDTLTAALRRSLQLQSAS